MTQSEFIRIMAVRQGLSQECVRRLVGALLDSLEEGLAEGERCILRGVGTLHIVRREGGCLLYTSTPAPDAGRWSVRPRTGRRRL